MAGIIALEAESSEDATMFLKGKDLEKQAGFAEPAEEEYWELADEELDAVAGGGDPSFGSTLRACSYCGGEQPLGWEGDTCFHCGYVEPQAPPF